MLPSPATLEILQFMRNERIKKAIQNDWLILRVADELTLKYRLRIDIHRKYITRILRELGRFLISFKALHGVVDLSDAIYVF